jgi:propanol-preferring alcohol dehydrogenase
VRRFDLPALAHRVRAGIASLRRGGRPARVAVPPETHGVVQLPIFDSFIKGCSVIAHRRYPAGPHRRLRLHALDRTRIIARGRKLDDVNAALDEVLSGHVTARLVFELKPTATAENLPIERKVSGM